jgi:hypothetical protein
MAVLCDTAMTRHSDFLIGVNGATRIGGLRLFDPESKPCVDGRARMRLRI